jgi:nucleoside-diphosphate-sugar epimerase
VRRLTEEVGWSPHYDLDRGLQDTLAWWKHNHSRAA